MNRVRYLKVPQGVAQNAILLFSSKFQLLSAAKFLHVKIFSGKVVASYIIPPSNGP